MFEYECSGKNVEKAIEEGLSKLKLDRDNVDIKILDTGGFFKKAKVILKIPEEIYNNSEEIKKIIALTNIEKKVETSQIKEKENVVKAFSTNETIKDNQTEEKQEIQEINYNKEIQPQNQLEECKKFLEDLCNITKFKVAINGSETEERVFLNLEGKNLSKLVGYKGECLNAIQLILGAISSKQKGRKKVILDIDGYKQKRKLNLESLANRMAKKVMETKEKVFLQPMPAYERRIIHNVIQGYPKLKSSSSGQEPNRILTIDLKK